MARRWRTLCQPIQMALTHRVRQQARLLRSAAIIGSYSLRAQGVDELAESAIRRITVGAGLLANLSCQPIEMAQSQCVRQSMEMAQSQRVREEAGS